MPRITRSLLEYDLKVIVKCMIKSETMYTVFVVFCAIKLLKLLARPQYLLEKRQIQSFISAAIVPIVWKSCEMKKQWLFSILTLPLSIIPLIPLIFILLLFELPWNQYGYS